MGAALAIGALGNIEGCGGEGEWPAVGAEDGAAAGVALEIERGVFARAVGDNVRLLGPESAREFEAVL